MKARTTILNIIVLGFGMLFASDRLRQQGDGMDDPQLRSGKVDGYRMQKMYENPTKFC